MIRSATSRTAAFEHSVIAALLLGTSGALHAQQTDTDTLTVTATVRSGCALIGGTLAFGDYVSGQSSNLDAIGSFSYVNCAAGTLTFELDGGSNASVSDRQMRAGQNRLRYQLFRNAARSATWGTGTDAHRVQLLQAGSGRIDVYGRIPAGQAIPPGEYADTVTITMSF